jgi:serine/threonine protein kinase
MDKPVKKNSKKNIKKKTKKRGKHYPYKFTNLKKAASRLGGGFFGDIYSMQNAIDKKIYAVKHIDIKKIQTTLTLFKSRPVPRSQTLEFILNESKTLAELDHKNIIRYYNTRYTRDTIYISLELMKGGNLEQAIKKNIFTSFPNKLYNILTQICSGLSYLHSKKMLHRDIKASNILLETTDYDNPVIKLGDFGLSCLLDGTHYDQKGTGNGAGDIFYRSPEAVAGQPYNEGDDNWAVGIVALELISGVVLYDCVSGKIFSQYKDFNVYIEQIVEDYCMPYEPGSYYEQLVFIIRGLLNVKPEDRLTSEQIVDRYHTFTYKKRIDRRSASLDLPSISPRVKTNITRSNSMDISTNNIIRLPSILPVIERSELIKKKDTKRKIGINETFNVEERPHSA